MDFVARAKALLATKARLGVMILPLAVAVPAMATSLPTSNFLCQQNDGINSIDCTGNSTVQQLPTFNGLDGLKFFGPNSGSYIFSNSNPSGGQSVQFSTAGAMVGGDLLAGFIVPVRYHFNLTGSGCCGASITGWSLTYSILQASGGAATVSFNSGQSNFTGDQSGSGNLVVSSTLFGNTATIVSSQISIFYTNFDGFTASLIIPSQSIDFNALPDTSTPEPATAGLIGAGIALAGGYRLIRRRHRMVLVKG